MFELSSLAAHFDVTQNRLYALKDQLLKRGVQIVDLISGNVSSSGITFPAGLLKQAIAGAVSKTAHYKPDPLGQLSARKAISHYYRAGRVLAPESQIMLTPGTSTSYWYAFKVLANPGDEILIPTPSYPLFDAIAELCQVKLVPYKLRECVHHRQGYGGQAHWEINFEHLESVITARAKAIILISPHNPTGAVATSEEVERLGQFAALHSLAVIADEVFSPFVFTDKPLARPLQTQAPLVLTLNGFSKMLALPGLKIGWILVSGKEALVKKTLHALDMISDTFLPVNEIAQAAVPALLKQSKRFQTTYVKEMKKRRDLAAKILRIAPPEGGFLLTVPLPKGADEDVVACTLLKEHHILTHPGYFYDIEGSHLVLSFAASPVTLQKSLSIISRAI